MYTALIQTRTSSKRLPKKVLKKILGNEIFIIVYKRVLLSKFIDKAIIITSNSKDDDIIEKICKKKNIPIFRGPLKNVLKRYYLAAKKFNLKNIVRITSDCPLIDPDVISQVCVTYKNGNFDYVSNVIKPTYPDGLDVEIFNISTLSRSLKNCKKNYDLEHVTSYIKRNDFFKKKNVRINEDFSNFRITLDNINDFKNIKYTFNKFRSIYKPRLKELIKVIKKNKNRFKFI